MTQCCLILILLFYVKEDYNHRRVDDKDDTVLPHPHPSILCKGRLQPAGVLTIRMTQCCLIILLFYVKEDYNHRRVDDKDDTVLPHPHPSILCKGRLQPQEG